MYDPYQDQTPYEVLGVAPTAAATEIRDRFGQLERETQEQGGDAVSRAKRLQTIREAYDKLRVASQRARIDFLLVDPEIGRRQCESVAESLVQPELKITGLVQPKSIRVSHSAAVAEMRNLMREPTRSLELHPHITEEDKAFELPTVLSVQFDC